MDSLVAGFEELQFPPKPCERFNSQLSRTCLRPGQPVTRQRLSELMDSDGRLVDELSLRHETFVGGIEPDVRPEAWRFLYELYPPCSTHREREVLRWDYMAKYLAMKERWTNFITNNAEKFDEPLDKLLCPTYLEDVAPTCDISAVPPSGDDPAVHQWPFIHIQAQIYAGRQDMDVSSFVSALRIIDKDVPRTDRALEFFEGPTNPHLRVLRDILLTYAAFHPDVGYAQGMNDIVSRFLIVLGSEVEAYWCFSHYIDQVKSHFLEDSILIKLDHTRLLLRELDPDLLSYLEMLEVADTCMTFCHRWILLCFKREFSHEDSLKVFEMLCCHHLEVNSLSAQKKLQTARQKHFTAKGGTERLAEPPLNNDFTFDVFMCVAILLKHRQQIFSCQDAGEAFAFICSLTMTLNLDEMMTRSEQLFYEYCKKSAIDCFELMDWDVDTAAPARVESVQKR